MSTARALNRPVPIMIAGTAWQARELDIAAIATLDSWLERVVPSPLAKVRPHLDGLPESDRKVLLAKAYDDLAGWPPTFGSREGNRRIFLTQEGRAQFLIAILRPLQPHLTEDMARDLAAKVTEAEFSAAMCVGCGVGPKAEIEAQIDPNVEGATPNPTKGLGSPDSFTASAIASATPPTKSLE